MERIQIPANAETIVSTSSKGDQSKWLVDLYKGDPFINRTFLLKALAKAPYDLGRAKDIVLSQLDDALLQRLIMD